MLKIKVTFARVIGCYISYSKIYNKYVYTKYILKWKFGNCKYQILMSSIFVIIFQSNGNKYLMYTYLFSMSFIFLVLCTRKERSFGLRPIYYLFDMMDTTIFQASINTYNAHMHASNDTSENVVII